MLDQLPDKAKHAHILPNLASHSLISVVTLCNAGCEVTFHKLGCTIKYKGKTIICGHKCTNTGLWMIPLQNTSSTHGAPTVKPTTVPDHTHTIANITHTRDTSSPSEYIKFLHQALGSPPPTTLLHALAHNEELQTIPGLTATLIHKHLRQTPSTDKGHLHQVRQHVASTHNDQEAIIAAREYVDNMQPTEAICTAYNVYCFAVLAGDNPGTMYTDLTGAFPVQSFHNNAYIFVAYIYDINAILVRPMPTKTDAAMIAAFRSILEALDQNSIPIHLNVMDNECSKTVAAYIRTNDIKLQLVPPHNHRVNAVERAIATFKDHFIASLSTVDPTCPIQLWDEFLPQVELTLNMLRMSRRTRSRSAHAELAGKFDWTKTPIAPLGTKSLIFDDPHTRGSWAPHGTDCYYVGPATTHYRCLKFWCPSSRRVRISDTFRLYPKHCTTPTISEHDRTILAAADIIQCWDLKIKPDTRHKLEHAQVMQQIWNLLQTPPRVPATITRPAPRVKPTPHPTSYSEPPRVTHGHPTSKTALQQLVPHQHQYNTRRTTPMPTLGDVNISPDVNDADHHTNRVPPQQSPQKPTRRSARIALQSPRRWSTLRYTP